mmetsp:Transcript_10869/g.24675  ORF Transcript_10869/g.24675 Transcript_10869/m.24675 type:complete len:415 (+) Transcript_10869:114-1358(+)
MEGENVVGIYSGHGYDHGSSIQYTLTLLLHNKAWMDYRSEPPEAGARIESWHSDGRYTLDVEDNKEVMKFQIDGLPGQGRAGKVYTFAVVSMEGPPEQWSFKAEDIGAVLQHRASTNIRGSISGDAGTAVKVCTECGKMIVGASVSTANGDVFCKSCMVCSKCGAELAGKSFQTVDGRRVCSGCSKVRCYACGRDITGQKTKVLDKFYHPECFKCQGCDKQLEGSFITKGDAVFCNKACAAQAVPSLTTPTAAPTPQDAIEGAKEEEEAPQDSPAPSASKESTQEPLDAQQTSEGKNIQAMPEPKAGLVQQEPKVELAAAPGSGAAATEEEEGQKPKATESQKTSSEATTAGGTLSLEVLQNHDLWKAHDVDPVRREDWLSDEDFVKVFDMPRPDFQALPKWKRDSKKKAAKLF